VAVAAVVVCAVPLLTENPIHPPMNATSEPAVTNAFIAVWRSRLNPRRWLVMQSIPLVKNGVSWARVCTGYDVDGKGGLEGDEPTPARDKGPFRPSPRGALG
jgi:hypothetical protein